MGGKDPSGISTEFLNMLCYEVVVNGLIGLNSWGSCTSPKSIALSDKVKPKGPDSEP